MPQEFDYKKLAKGLLDEILDTRQDLEMSVHATCDEIMSSETCDQLILDMQLVLRSAELRDMNRFNPKVRAAIHNLMSAGVGAAQTIKRLRAEAS